jgi:hypothetical protein
MVMAFVNLPLLYVITPSNPSNQELHLLERVASPMGAF